MTIVDAHAHASPYWLEPVEVLLYQMNSNGVEKATLVGLDGQTHDKYNRYLIECARRFPGRFSPVIVIDAERSDASAVLAKWAREGAEGLRLGTNIRSPGEDPLALWKACGECGLPVSCKGGGFASDEFHRLVQALPTVTFILEHLGKPKLDEAYPFPTYKKTLGLAGFPNVYIKVGGMGEICKRPFPFRDPFYTAHEAPAFIRMAYDAFGPSRMMWSSNYPPSGHLEGYRNTLRYVEDHLDTFCSREDKEWIFGRTALNIYRFAER